MSSRNLFIAASIACMTGALFGYSVGFIGGVLVLPSFRHHFNLDQLPAPQLAAAQSRIVSSWLVGCVIGVPLSVPVCSRYGRKLCITFSAGLYIVGAIFQLINFDSSIGIFQLGRLINGIGVGAGTLVSPVFISEISPSTKRGTLLSGYQVAIQIFALIGFWGAFVCNSTIGKTSDLQWQIPVSIQLLPSTVLLAGSVFVLPESPQWLVSQGQLKPASSALAWLRMVDDKDAEVNSEMHRLQTIVNRAKIVSARSEQSFLSQISTPPLRKRMLVGTGIMIFQNMVGLNALNYFSPIIFMSAGFTSVSASLFLTGLFGVVKLITALLFMFIFVRIRGNRFWLILGSTIMAAAMFVLAFCIKQMPPHAPDHKSGMNMYGVVSVMMVLIFAFAFGVSLGPISWNVCAEIFPAHINTKACAITTCIQWLSQILIASITPPMIASIGWATYLFYGICCVLAAGFCAIFVPETRGITMGLEMDRAFGDLAKDDGRVEVTEVEDVNETTPLVSDRRRRSSVALVV